jgi:hypothetical protein
MIDCATATDLLLVAAPAELRGAGDSELAAHVRTCASCRAQAELLLAEEARLARALDTLTALHTATVSDRRPLRRWAPRLLLPLAAAAAAMVVLMTREAQRNRGPLPPLLVPPTRVAEVPVVNASSRRNVAIMRTSDPRITVVWYY